MVVLVLLFRGEGVCQHTPFDFAARLKAISNWMLQRHRPLRGANKRLIGHRSPQANPLFKLKAIRHPFQLSLLPIALAANCVT